MLLSLLLSFSVVPCLVVLPINLSAQRLGSASLRSRAPKVGFRGVTMRMFDGEADRTTANRTTESSCEFASATPNEKKQWHIFFFSVFFAPRAQSWFWRQPVNPLFFRYPNSIGSLFAVAREIRQSVTRRPVISSVVQLPLQLQSSWSRPQSRALLILKTWKGWLGLWRMTKCARIWIATFVQLLRAITIKIHLIIDIKAV